MKQSLRILSTTIICIFLFCCRKKIPDATLYRIGIDKCARQPLFLRKIGFNPLKSAFNTNMKNIDGIALIEFPENLEDTANYKIYQDETWKQKGWMGAITTGEDGTTYTVPVPKLNLYDVSLSKMNRIYKIEPVEGKMQLFCNLPMADTSNNVVPFAVLGLFYDCHSNRVYASSVAGSTQETQKGVIYSINPKNGKIEDKIEGYDAIGMIVCGISGEKKLYFGSARNSNIYSVEVDTEGNFLNEPSIEFSIDQLGPRGDDKARKIRVNLLGNLEVYGVEFNYNLIANTKNEQSIYQFQFKEDIGKWVFIDVK